MTKLFGVMYVILFVSLAFGFFALMYLIEPMILYFYCVMLVLMSMRYILKWRNGLTRWARDVMTSIDQHWQVLMAPILNIGVTTRHKFGNPDETASSVIGKNLRDTGLFRWRAIEFVISIILEGGKPHSIPSIEEETP